MHRHRTAVRLALLTLLAGALVPLGAAPAAATPGCLDETPPPGPIRGLPLADGCDDSPHQGAGAHSRRCHEGSTAALTDGRPQYQSRVDAGHDRQ